MQGIFTPDRRSVNGIGLPIPHPPLSVSLSSPPYTTVRMGKTGDHYISWAQCLQPIDPNATTRLTHRVFTS